MGTSTNGWESGNPINSACGPPTIATIAAVAAAFLIVTYYRFLYRRCLTWLQTEEPPVAADLEAQPAAAPKGLDENCLKRMPIYRFERGYFPACNVDCTVCLLSFIDGDAVRILPTCGHAFHAVCVDAWLSSHTSCPLCRADVTQIGPVTWSQVHRFACRIPKIGSKSKRLDGEYHSVRGFACICEYMNAESHGFSRVYNEESCCIHHLQCGSKDGDSGEFSGVTRAYRGEVPEIVQEHACTHNHGDEGCEEGSRTGDFFSLRMQILREDEREMEHRVKGKAGVGLTKTQEAELGNNDARDMMVLRKCFSLGSLEIGVQGICLLKDDDLRLSVLD